MGNAFSLLDRESDGRRHLRICQQLGLPLLDFLPDSSGKLCIVPVKSHLQVAEVLPDLPHFVVEFPPGGLPVEVGSGVCEVYSVLQDLRPGTTQAEGKILRLNIEQMTVSRERHNEGHPRAWDQEWVASIQNEPLPVAADIDLLFSVVDVDSFLIQDRDIEGEFLDERGDQVLFAGVQKVIGLELLNLLLDLAQLVGQHIQDGNVVEEHEGLPGGRSAQELCGNRINVRLIHSIGTPLADHSL